MRGASHARPALKPRRTGTNAVVWIEPGRALIVRDIGTDAPALLELPLPEAYAATPAALADVAIHVGDVDRLLVLGDADLRIALEREVVALGHRPEAIREEPIDGPLDADALVALLRRLR